MNAVSLHLIEVPRKMRIRSVMKGQRVKDRGTWVFRMRFLLGGISFMFVDGRETGGYLFLGSLAHICTRVTFSTSLNKEGRRSRLGMRGQFLVGICRSPVLYAHEI